MLNNDFCLIKLPQDHPYFVEFNELFELQTLNPNSDLFERYDQLLQAIPDCAELHNNIGVALATRGERLGAYAQFLHATALNVNLQEVRANLLLSERMGDSDDPEITPNIWEKLPINIMVSIYSTLFSIGCGEMFLESLAMLCEPLAGQNINAFLVLFWQINRQLYSRKNSLSKDCYLRIEQLLVEAHCRLVNVLSAHIEEEWHNRSLKKAQGLMLITNQFLGSTSHSPTKVIIDFAEGLKTHNVTDVCLVNTKCLSRSFSTPFFKPGFTFFNEINNFQGLQLLDNATIPIYSASSDSPVLSRVWDCITFVLDNTPEAVISYGNFNLVADVLSNFIPVVYMPVSSANFCSYAHSIIPCSSQSQSLLAERLPYEQKRSLFRVGGGVKLSSFSEPYNRSQFKIAEDAFIFVIMGNRLDIEVNDEFKALVISILRRTNNTFIIFAGTKETLIENEVYSDRLRYIGYENNPYSLFAMCNAFLNPDRIGGGISAVMAAFAGLPILTLKGNDVSEVIGASLSYDSFADIEEEAVQMSTNADYYTMRCACIKALHIEHQFDQNISTIIAAIDDAKNVFYSYQLKTEDVNREIQVEN